VLAAYVLGVVLEREGVLMNIVKLPITNLGDLPAKLRELADTIDAGKHPGIESIFVVIPRDNDYPVVYGFGSVEGDNNPIVQLELAKAWFVNNLTGRN